MFCLRGAQVRWRYWKPLQFQSIGVTLGLLLLLIYRRTFAEFHWSPLNTVLSFTFIFLFSNSCFSVEPAQFHPFARCVSPWFEWKKSWKSGKIKRQTLTRELQNEEEESQPQKFAPTLALKWYPQSKVVDVSAANQPAHLLFGSERRGSLQKAVFHFAARIDVNWAYYVYA